MQELFIALCASSLFIFIVTLWSRYDVSHFQDKKTEVQSSKISNSWRHRAKGPKRKETNTAPPHTANQPCPDLAEMGKGVSTSLCNSRPPVWILQTRARSLTSSIESSTHARALLRLSQVISTLIFQQSQEVGIITATSWRGKWGSQRIWETPHVGAVITWQSPDTSLSSLIPKHSLPFTKGNDWFKKWWFKVEHPTGKNPEAVLGG